MFANLIYAFALAALSPFILYRMIRHGRYRRGLGEKLWGLSAQRGKLLRGNTTSCIWIHAVSVGEVNLLPGVIAQLAKTNPGLSVAISTSTDTGYDVAVKHFGADRVFFCPLDFTWAVNRTIRNLAPTRLVLAELELWPNLVRLATAARCDVVVINARLSQRSAARYQQFRRLTESTFANLVWVGCQDQASADHFLACGTSARCIAVTGSLKFDDAPTSRDTNAVQSRHQWAGVDPWHRVWMFGSTQSGEEQIALNVYRALQTKHSELRLILVPRHPERFDAVAQLIKASGLKVHRRSCDESLFDDQWNSDTVILIDTIGELRHWWGVGQIATVGGSFGNRGGQNMLEPAGYGSAVSFGPNTRNFAEIADKLIQAEAAIRVADEAELAAFVSRCLTDIPAADALGRAAAKLVDSQRGATERTVDAIAGRMVNHEKKKIAA